MPSRPRSLVQPILVLLMVAAAGYAAVRFKHSELIDFAVPRTAAARFLAAEPLYRPEDGHYQYKYLPAFAPLMVPFTWVSKEVAEFTWFALTVAMAWAFVRLSLAALPDRRRAPQPLVWLTLLLTGKFLVKELALGQFNLPLALLLLSAVIAAQHGEEFWAGASVAAGVFVKPYALVLVPWLAWTLGWRPFVPFGLVLAAGLLLPAASYGWNGNLTLLHEWYRTVATTTEPNLLSPDNMSFASMWAKWIRPGPAAEGLALASAVGAVVVGLFVMSRRRHVAEPNYLEGAYFFTLVPLLSPQGWDYVLVLALPAYMCLVDRWRDLSPAWRATALMGFFLTSFLIFDLLRRPLYMLLLQLAAASLGAVLVAACLVYLRWRAVA
ncbi:MAG TPA: glycosyltransferase family 87 protein [Vicinamibacterales bacterium]|nr:glycosyltransferase family 87 protein [Vicinamibacterales bacterium]